MGKRSERDTVSLRHVDFLVLAVLTEAPLHGYGVVQAIDRATDGRVTLRPGDVYRVLYRLERRGLLAAADAATVTDAADDDRRSYYAITDLGRRVAQAESDLLASVSRRFLSGDHGSVA